MLTRIRIQGFKSFDDVEVKLSPLTVLLGPNAAGKSNFLDVLQLLSRLATRASVQEAFDPPYRGTPLESFSFGSDGIRNLLKQDTVTLSITADVELSNQSIEETNAAVRDYVLDSSRVDSSAESNVVEKSQGYVREQHLRYAVDLRITPRYALLRVGDEHITALTPEGIPKQATNSQLTRYEQHLQTAMKAPERSILSAPFFLHDFPHLYALRLELSRWSYFYFEPRERMREPNAVRETRHIGMMGENLASFLNTLQALDLTQYQAVERSIRLLVPSLSGLKVEVNDRGEVVLHLLEDGKPIPASVLSEGTLRLLGLIALGGAKARPTLIGFEEPENGVHPRRIRLIAELLKSYTASGETQMVVTTHSPTLLDALPRESLYVCRKLGGRTRIVRAIDLDPIGQERDLTAGFDAGSELAMSERMLRGDFDA